MWPVERTEFSRKSPVFCRLERCPKGGLSNSILGDGKNSRKKLQQENDMKKNTAVMHMDAGHTCIITRHCCHGAVGRDDQRSHSQTMASAPWLQLQPVAANAIFSVEFQQDIIQHIATSHWLHGLWQAYIYFFLYRSDIFAVKRNNGDVGKKKKIPRP